MNENSKTGIFVGVAALLGLLAVLTLPKSAPDIRDDVEQIIGKPLFEKFTDPTVASSLQITKYDADMGSLKPFELAQEKSSKAWIIPSHDSYPADAAAQVSKVANLFIGLKILTLESTKTEDQKLYGVIEPDVSKLKVGDTDVGTSVKIKDDKGESLVDIIIGKTVREDPTKRYVRKAGTDPIYTAQLDTTPLVTDFSTWIEGDLLKLSSNDIETLTIRDYNILPNARGQGELSKNFDAEVTYSTKENKWLPKSIKTFPGPEPAERALTDDEQLNATRLNEMKSALDNLKIVDVVRKPKGLASDLKADKSLLDDNAKILSLAKKGFIPGPAADGTLELYSSSGELAVTLNDGVEYLLRFGNATADVASTEDGKEKKSDNVSLNRNLFVTAKLNESRYPMPELKPLPETIEQLKEMEAAAKEPKFKPANPKIEAAEPSKDAAESEPAAPTEESKSKDAEPVDEPSNGEKPTAPTEETKEEPASDAPKVEPSKEDSSMLSNSKSNRLVSFLQEEKKEEQVTPADEDGKKDEPTAEKEVAKESEKPEAPAADKDKPADAPVVETEEELKERLDAAREKITKENKRLIDARNDKLEAAKKKASELNARFAEWYYEISDSDYKRLRISLEELIQKKSEAANQNAAPDFSNGFPGGGGLPFNLPGGN